MIDVIGMIDMTGIPSLFIRAATGLVSTTGIATNDAGGTFWMPPQASTVATSVDKVYYLIYWICVFFFVLIMGLTIWFVVKYRRREGHSAEITATHNTPLELTWTIIPLILAAGIFFVGLEGYVDIVQAPLNSYEIRATAQKWSWNFEHRNGASDSQVLKVPAGRPVKITMTSADVLHAMFIPAFRVKQDAVPGRYTYVSFTAPDPGRYQLFCAEYCGTDHSQMTATVLVLPEDEFLAEIDADARFEEGVSDEDLPFKVAPRIFPRCSSCHSLDGSVKIGPSFQQTHDLWGKERVLEGGETVVVDDNYIRSSILNPHGQVVENYPKQMPSFQGQLNDRRIESMIELIKRLDEVVDENGNWLIDASGNPLKGG